MAALPLYEHIKNLFKKTKFVSSDGEFLTGKIFEAIEKLDKNLITILLKDAKTKEHFFVSIEDTFVLDQNKLFDFFNSREYFDSSYTSYTNKIGLIRKDSFIKKFDDVVLAWPYKDCVLEGGMSSEDKGKSEVFYNSIISKDEIDRLFEPKVLTNIKKYTKEGATVPDEITMDDNLIIKGNNLLALHSLKKRYAGRVKLIYIDPPYNTDSAANTFAYNNRFNHSSWLTFMKNRMEIAKTLLADNGIFIFAIDHYELFYLGVLADEIFGRENRMGVLAVVHNPGGRQDEEFFPTAHENMVVYAKNIKLAKLNTMGVTDKKLSEFKLLDKYGKYKLRDFRRSGNNSLREQRPALFYEIYYDSKTNSISLEKHSEHLITIKPIDASGAERCWRWGKDTLLEKMDMYIEVKKVKNRHEVYIKERESDYVGEKAKSLWNKAEYTGQTATHNLKQIFEDKVFSYPKSPYLMRDIIQVASEKDDIILDFHAGSGTTAHAVLDLNKEDGGNRKFILVEQMDYIETVTAERVKKVIEKNGEGSFVYAELKTIDNFKDENTIGALNKNMQYLPIGEMDDEEYGISEAEKKLNKQFYGLA